MFADLLPTRRAVVVRAERSTRTPDPAYDATLRYRRLAAELQASLPAKRSSRWKEPAVFFFDPKRQCELEAARAKAASEPDALRSRIAAELPGLLASVELRRVARAVPELLAAAQSHPAGHELAEVLAVADDETMLVLHPQARSGYRLFLRGIADIAQLHVLLLNALADCDPLFSPLPSRFRVACAERNPVIPAGVPMVAESPFQFFHPAALQADGQLPTGFRGCQHWLWGTQPLARIPRLDGERVLLLGEPAFRQSWEVERRFPALAAEVRLLEALSPFKAVERLSRIVGHALPVHSIATETAEPVLARAA